MTTVNGGKAESISIANEVPEEMKRLVRLVMRMFYSQEHQLIMDMLVRNSIMTEDELCERLLFERKQLRTLLNALRNDKFVCIKMQLQTVSKDAAKSSGTTASGAGESSSNGSGQANAAAAGEKSLRITYYYIDYKLFTNVLKYRLDLMRKRFENEQRDTTSRASFYCPQCGNTYTDLEISHLYDRTTGSLFCTYCRSEVQEKEDQSDSHMNARARISKFQTQVRDPIDALLKACDGIHLSSASLEPVVKPLQYSRETDIAFADRKGPNGDRHKWSGEKTRPSSSMGSDMSGSRNRSQNITVTFNSAAEESQIAKQPLKEQPSWLKESVSLTRNGFEGSSSVPNSSGSVVVTGNSLTTSINTAMENITQTLAPGRVPNTSVFMTSAATTNASSLSNTSGGATVTTSSGSSSTTAGVSTSGFVISGSAGSGSKALTDEDIMSTLLAYERKGMHKAAPQPARSSVASRQAAARSGATNRPPVALSDSDDSSSSGDEDPAGKRRGVQSNSHGGNHHEGDDHFHVTIQGRPVPYNDITEDMIHNMTPEEQEEYIEMGRRIHEMIGL